MDRRQMILGVAAAAVPLPAVATLPAADPLAAALADYKVQSHRFNTELPDDYSDEQANAFADETYGRVYYMDPLPAATTLTGVAAALRTMLSEAERGAELDDFIERNIRAALAYFEREGM
ncbi:hypothetical protein [Ancylobacter oerskovii]|uniref:Uncharacterized protein n=1 Tax=Ancylobacter oerskovii TaxID=459519 RepID=A0ABW4YVQ0_9HYPH|nr:hypothetical protein [Ancylobacter oerskovii]MBS7543209.1 hypothetical protein [Ancylobacter oerskovii]